MTAVFVVELDTPPSTGLSVTRFSKQPENAEHHENIPI